MVISFAMLAGANSSSALFSNSTVPESASIRMACGASVWKFCAKGGGAAKPVMAAEGSRNQLKIKYLRVIVRVPGQTAALKLCGRGMCGVGSFKSTS